MWPRSLILFLFCLTSGWAMAQSMIEVTGVVKDKDNGDLLIGASVQIFPKDHPEMGQGMPTELDGSFRFRVSQGLYELKISFIGYNPLSQELDVNSETSFPIEVKLVPNALILEQAEVTATAVRAEQIGDTTQFNADAYKVNQDASAEQLIEKMPGVVIKDGQMEAQGEKVQEVMVDGKPFFGNDPNAALKNIPAQMIDKVQIFDQKSEQTQFTGFDDGETKKTINIVTKPDYRTGNFGRVYAGGGPEEEYKAGGVLNSFNDSRRITVMAQLNNVNEQNFASEDLSGVAAGNGGGGRRRWDRGNVSSNVNDFLVGEQGGITTTEALGINYSDELFGKIEVSSSYFLNRTRNNAASELYRQYILAGDSGQVYTESNTSRSTNVNHRFNLRLKYKVNDNNTFIFRPGASLQQNSGVNRNFGETLIQDAFLNSSDNTLSTEFDAWSLQNFMMWQHKFGKNGRSLSIDLDQTFRNNNGERFLFAENTFADLAFADTLDQFADLMSFEQEHRLDISYTEPINDNLQLMFNYEPSYLINSSDRKTYDYFLPQENYTELDTLLSNVFESEFIIHEGGAGIRYNKEKVSIMARANAQLTNLNAVQDFPTAFELNRDFTAILPMFHMRMKISKDKNFFMVMRSRSSVPQISQLQDVIDNSNPLQLSSGNSALDQSISHMLFSRYSATNTSKGKVFNASLRGSFTQDYIGNSTLIAQEPTILEGGYVLPTGARYTRPVNLDGQASMSAFLSYGFPVRALKSNLNVESNFNLNRTPALINGEENIALSPGIGAGLSLASSFSTKFDFTISARPQMNYVINSLTPEADSRFFSQESRFRLYWNFWKKMVYRTEMTHLLFTGLSEDFNQNFMLWNMSLGTKLMKDDQLELNLSVFDALRQNNSISRTVTETTIDDLQTMVLQRYFMVNLIWNIRAFGKGSDQNDAPQGRGGR